MSPKENLSRAELVRQRRQNQAGKVVDRSRSYRTVTTVSRRTPGAPYTPLTQPVQPAVRPAARRASLNLPGVQVSAPAIPSLRPGWRLVSLTLSVLIGWALLSLWTAPAFRVVEAQVLGNQRLGAADINAGLGVSGQPLIGLSPAVLERTLLQAYPDLASAEVRVLLPNRVRVVVTERQPLIAWMQADPAGVPQLAAWIDAQGVAFTARGQVEGLVAVLGLGTPPRPEQDPEHPYVVQPYMQPGLVQALVALAPHAPPGTPVLYDPRYGLGWQDSRGWLVYFGLKTDDILVKLRVYQAVADHLVQAGIQPVLVSVEFPDAPFYRLEP